VTGVLELYGARIVSNANSETKVQAIVLQLYSPAVILLAVAFVNVKVHALYDLRVCFLTYLYCVKFSPLVILRLPVPVAARSKA
jgi:hypothetical protein